MGRHRAWRPGRMLASAKVATENKYSILYVPCWWLGSWLAASVSGTRPRAVGDTVAAAVVAAVDWPTNCCACSSALTWVRMSSRSSVNDSPVDPCWGSAGVEGGEGRCWEEAEPAAAVLASVEDRAERRTVRAVEGPADRQAVAVERRFDLGLGMFTGQ